MNKAPDETSLTAGSGLKPPGQVFVVADVAQAHDGSLGQAHAFVDVIARAGADAVKFQTHIAAAESTPAEGWRVKFSPQDATRFDYWKRMEFTEEQWHGLKKHADEAGLKFISSPFSPEAVELLTRVGVCAWKVASGEVGNLPLLELMARTRLPFILSSGMSPLDELDAAVAKVQSWRFPLTVLQCTTMYPTPPEKVGLNLLAFFRERYNCAVGLSDHSGTIFPGLAAAALGAEVIEVHVCFSREMFGPDVQASLTLPELRQLADGIRFIQKTRANPVEKDKLAGELSPLRKLFNKSLALRADLPAGAVLREENLTGKKPGTGIPLSRLKEFAGRRLKRAVRADELLAESDFE